MSLKSLFLLLTLLYYIHFTARAQKIELDTTTWITNGAVNAILRNSEYIFLGGQFTYIGPNTGGGAIISKPEGKLIDGPILAVDGYVRTVVADGMGGWYIGGSFTLIQGLERNGIAHILSNGQVDKEWNPNPVHMLSANVSVATLVLSGSTLYIGGSFTSFAGVSRNHLAAINATSGELTNWNPNANGYITTLSLAHNIIYIGGNFTSVGGQSRAHLAALDASSGQVTAWNPGTDREVSALLVWRNRVYAGGAFTSIAGNSKKHLAALDTATGELINWGPVIDANEVLAICVFENTLFVGGSFALVNDQIRTNFAALDISTGQLMPLNLNINGNVRRLIVSDNTLYLAGGFTSIGGLSRSNFAAIDLTTYQVTSWNPLTSNRSIFSLFFGGFGQALAVNGENIFVGGDLTSIGGEERNNLVAVNRLTGKPASWKTETNYIVRALSSIGDTVYVGGEFSSINGQTRNRLAAIDATTGELTSWNPNPILGITSAIIRTLAVSNNSVYVGGHFSSIDGQNRNNLAAFNAITGELTTWNPNVGNGVYGLFTSGNLVYAGGNFSSVNGQTRQFLAAIDVITGKVTDWNPSANNTVTSFAISGNTVYVGGSFSSVNGQTRNGLAALDATTGELTSWNPNANGPVNALSLSGNEIIVGGTFTTIGGQNRNYLAPIHMSSGLVMPWPANPSYTVQSVHVSNNTIYVGGNFSKVGSTRISNYACFRKVSPTYYVKGNIYEDTNGNCIKEPAEKGLLNKVVVARPGDYFTSSDSLGNYTLALDSGSYTIEQLLPKDKMGITTQLCPANPSFYTVKLTDSGTTIEGKDFVNLTLTKPFLSVDVSSSRRRRCFTATTSVIYQNTGNLPAEDVKVYVKFPEYVVLVNASVPYTIDNEKNYVFSMGRLPANTRGHISILDSVVCNDPNIRGRSQCTKAWITPANALTPSPLWDKSDIVLNAKCIDNGRVRFALLNKGLGSMADSSSFRIFLDTKIAFKAHYKLASGDSLILQVPANGQTVRLEADQSSYHPIKQQSNITLEACGINQAGNISLGYVAQLPQDDIEPEVAIQCLPIIDSYDPNDKKVSPSGVTSERVTPTNTALHYLIRFQNTGTDVAYKVVVVDTLSKDVDMSTLQVGAVSHAYKLTVSGKEKPVLTFTFNNINLPDSTTIEPGSNGYINFSIAPKVDLPEKTRIKNYADISFDYNPPVRTNTTLNTIYDLPDVVDESVKLEASPICYTLNTTVNAGINRIVCEQDTLYLKAITPIKGEGIWKLISGELTIENINDAHTIVNSLGYGDHLLEWSVAASSCKDSLRAQVLITRLAKPVTPIITQIGMDSLTSGTIADSYQWYRNGESLTINTRTIYVNKEGNYTVRVSDNKDCTSAMSVAFVYVLTNVEPDFASQVKIYPNPNHGKFTLALPAEISQEFHLQIFNELGRTIISQRIKRNSNNLEIDLVWAPAGLYLLKLQTSNGLIVRRIIKK